MIVESFCMDGQASRQELWLKDSRN